MAPSVIVFLRSKQGSRCDEKFINSKLNFVREKNK